MGRYIRVKINTTLRIFQYKLLHNFFILLKCFTNLEKDFPKKDIVLVQ